MKTSVRSFLFTLCFCSITIFSNAEMPKKKADEKNAISKLNNPAFGYGEKLEYRMHYGPFNAGYASLEIMPEPVVLNGKKTMNIKCSARSSRTIDALYNKVRNDYESFLDVDAMVPLKYTKKIEEGKYRDSDFALFDHENKRINTKKGNITDAPNQVQDLVSVYYWSRLWDVSNAKIGDTYPTEFYMDGKVYNYSIKFLGREKVKVDAGKFNAIKIRPQVKTGDLFKSEDALTLWVSDDDNHMVLKVESEIFIGSVAMSLTSFQNLKNAPKSKIN